MDLAQTPDLLEFPLASDERGELDRQGGLAGSIGPERREVPRQARRDQLVDPLRLGEIAQEVVAPVEQPDIRPQPVADEARRDAGDQHLAPVADREEPRDAIEGRPEVVAVACLGGAHVEGHPDPDWDAGLARERGEAPLAVDRPVDRGRTCGFRTGDSRGRF